MNDAGDRPAPADRLASRRRLLRAAPLMAAAIAVAQVYVLVVGELPHLTPDDTSVLVSCIAGSAAIYLCIGATLPLYEDLVVLRAVAGGGLVLVAILAIADVGAAATPTEAVAFGALGAALAAGLPTPGMALALPAFVAVVDLVSTLAGGLSEHLANAGTTKRGDPLSLEMPEWALGGPAGRLGISDAVFAGVFLLYAHQFGLRPRATAVALWLVTVLAIVLHVWQDSAIPVLPLAAGAYYLVNADRLWSMVGILRRG